jgi:multidrug efflux pump subunit AcrB
MWIVKVALERPYTFLVLAILILLMGVLSILRTAVDIFPAINIPVVAAIWTYTGLQPEEMASRIVLTTERVAQTTVNDVEHTESQSLNGIGVVKYFFQPKADERLSYGQITGISQTQLKNLPPGTTPPFILAYNASTVPIIQLALSSDSMSESEIFDVANNEIRTALATVPGASIPYPYGGKQREVQVDLDPQALRSKGLSGGDVVSAISAQNLILPAGTQKIGELEYFIGVNASPLKIEEMNDLPINGSNGQVTYIRDVAHVYDGAPPQTNIARLEGKRAALMTVLKNGSASTLDIINSIKSKLPQIQQLAGSALKIEPIGDQSVFVRASISGVVREATIAACLTGLMILLFLGSWRSTLIIFFSIPLSILASIACLAALGETINIMTLGGLALAVGILVDDATVTIENINSHLEEGAEVRAAILEGARQIALPALVSTLSICIVFVPMFLLAGIAKYLFVPMAEAVVFAMLASYLLSRTLIPTLAMYWLKKHEGGGEKKADGGQDGQQDGDSGARAEGRSDGQPDERHEGQQDAQGGAQGHGQGGKGQKGSDEQPREGEVSEASVARAIDQQAAERKAAEEKAAADEKARQKRAVEEARRNQRGHGFGGKVLGVLRKPLDWMKRFQQGFEHRFERIRGGYHRILEAAMHSGMRFAALFLAAMVLSAILAFPLGHYLPGLGQDFFPIVDAGQIKLHFRARTGLRIEETAALCDAVEAKIRQVIPGKELESVVDNIGLPYSGINLAYSTSAPVGPNDADIFIALKPDHKPSAGYQRTLRAALAESFPSVTFAFLPADIVSQTLNFGLPSPIDVQVSGKDVEADRNYADELLQKMRAIPGAVDLRVQQPYDYPKFDVTVDRAKAQELGLTQLNVASNMLVSLSGSFQTSPSFWIDPKSGTQYQVVAQTPQSRLDTLNDLQTTPITGSNSSSASSSSAALQAAASSPLSGANSQLLANVATVRRDVAPAVVSHYDAQTVFDIYGSADGADLGFIASEVNKILKDTKGHVPKGSQVAVRGQVQTMTESFNGLLLGLLGAILLVYLLIVVNFQSWLDPFIIITALPAALAGIVWMLFLSHTTVSVPALTGAIMCMGVATANSVLVISFARERMDAGDDAFTAASQAGFSRFRPVMMTALAMIIGMIPMALSLGEGAEQNAPLGRAVIGGLVFATVATLLFVPTVFVLIHGRNEHKEQKNPQEPQGQVQQ